MKISKEFQGFFFGYICPEVKNAPQPLKYQNPFTMEWYLLDFTKVSDEGVYQMLKLINPHYPKLQSLLPASTKVITAKHMTQHIQWVERWLGQNGHSMPHIEEEWERILQNAGITKENR